MQQLRIAGSALGIMLLYGLSSDTPNPAPPPASAGTIELELAPPPTIQGSPVQKSENSLIAARDRRMAAGVAVIKDEQKAEKAKPTGRWVTRRYGLFGRRTRRVWIENRPAADRGPAVPCRRGIFGRRR